MHTSDKKDIPLLHKWMKKLVEMLRTGFKEKQYIIEDLINPGAYVLAGAPKCGKTILATQIAVVVNIVKFHIHIYQTPKR